MDFSAFNDLVVTNTMFKHRLCHQQMWFDPAEREGQGHMKEYVLINHWFRSSVLDKRIFRKAYLHSNHMLVVAKM